jgi:RimJ/RimL family protein N-acetyltransferase
MPFDLSPTLSGSLLTLRPLQSDDFPTLYALASDPQIWQQHPAWDRYKEPVFRKLFDEVYMSGGTLVAVANASGVILGCSRYHGYSEDPSEVEIGWTFLDREVWGGRYNGEMKRLMLQHAFRFVESVVFLVGPANIRSQRAVQKIGGVRDGSRVNGSGQENYLYRINKPDFDSRRFG